MTTSLRCPQGHTWQIEPSADGATPVCPSCGAAPLAPDGRTVTFHTVTLTPADPHGAETIARSAATTNLATSAGRPSVPGYELLGELGHGGMGVVYQARQLKLNRLVALKMILAGSHAGAGEQARFQTEAQAIARLQHPNIVQVHEVGEHEGRPFFSLEFCGGGSLARRLSGTPLVAREAAALVETLARAMQVAHDQHIIHRDLKPANVLLARRTSSIAGPSGEEDRQGSLSDEFVPKIADFGLAKKLDEAGQTHSGAIMGTPSYMAPEQAGGKSAEIGPAADVYALGAILYECLTGRPPFKAATALDTLLQVVNDEPVAPAQLQTKTPRDLETICLKCLHKEPRKRYATARRLADDLRRFLAGEPIQARPVGRVERVLKWVKRNPSQSWSLAAGLMIATVSFVVVVVLWLSADFEREQAIKAQNGEAMQRGKADAALARARSDAQAARAAEKLAEARKALAEQREQETQYQLATSNVLLAQAAWSNNSSALARERLAAVPPELRRWEWHYLNRQYQGGIFALHVPASRLACVAFSCDGTRLAAAGADKTARVWDARTGQFLLQCTGHTDKLTSVAFSSDGTRLATASEDKTARLWDAQTGQLLRVCKGHSQGVRSVAFSPDGTRLATASDDKTARLWDARTGQFLRVWKHVDRLASVAFSPDGTRLAISGSDKTVRLWDARTGLALLECTGHTSHIYSVTFSPDGTRLATASTDKTARLWDARTGESLLECKGHPGEVYSVTFSPDGTRLATTSAHLARLWDARTGLVLLECHGHAGKVRSVAFSPEGTRLATASDDETVRLWDARTGQPYLECQGHTNQVFSVTFNRQGTRLATASGDRTARLWDARTGQLLETLGHTETVTCAAFSPDGMRLATASTDKTVRLWDAWTGQLRLECKGHTGIVRSVAFSPDGTQLATASIDKTARVWDARTGQPLFECKEHRSLVRGATFSPDGRWLATASSDKTARLWDAQTGQPLLEFTGHTETVTSVAFSPDGTRIATASWDQTARLWNGGGPANWCSNTRGIPAGL